MSMPRSSGTVLSLLSVLFASSASAQSFPIRPRDFTTYMQRALEAFATPGAAVAVVKDGKIVLMEGYGVRKLGDTTKVDANTNFAIASLSKAFTAATIAQLVDEKKLTWDTKVVDVLPNFRLYDPYVTQELTIRDILSHRSGLGLGGGDLLWMYSNFTPNEMVAQMRHLKPASSFRSRYAYQNVMFLVAGQVVEQVTGKPWDQVVAERVFAPLGMSRTTTSVSAQPADSNVATPHAVVDRKLQIVPYDTVDNIRPVGGINSNLSDLTKWMMAQLDSGRTATGDVWSRDAAREMWTPQTLQRIGTPAPQLIALRANFAAYGLGWGLRDYRGRKLVTHTGGLAGMSSRLMLVPEERLGILVLTNQQSALYDAVTWRILDAYLGAPATDWITGFQRVMSATETSADSLVRARDASRDSTRGPSLPLPKYTGTWRDQLLGDASITEETGHLVLRLSRNPAFVGDLKHYQHDTFTVTWRDRRLADAFVTFALEPDGTLRDLRLAPISPLADFSFDYQDLLYVPVRP